MKDLKELLPYTKKLKVLYVEDDKIVLSSALEMFGNFFNDITSAHNGEEALKLYQNNAYDLLITDISMPKVNGVELIREIKKIDPTLPIIVFSAWNDSSYMSECIGLNVDAYMLKPLDTTNLIESLKKITFKLSSEKNLFKSTFDIDNLTKLKSHNALLEEIQNVSKMEIPVMILINVDDFHIYNELYGLDIGDKILCELANSLQKINENRSYTLYRMSGDEFVFFEKATSLDPEKYIEDIEALFTYIEDNPISIEGIEEKIILNLTVGISFHDDNIYGRAVMALNEARKRGRNYLGFSADTDRRKELQSNLYWKEKINRAIANKNIHTYYQPIVNKDKEILKYEALIRMKQVKEDGSTETIVPNHFIDFSKISKQYIALTKVVIEEAFETMIKHNVHVAINITYHDIENKEINKLLHQKISNHTLASKTKFDISSQVIFELLEHSNHDDYDCFMEFINEFKALGVLITIDNFGLGFANMSKISAMAPNYVKIDSTLMKNIASDKHAYLLVKAIVKFAQELGIKTIAEHVSNKSIFDLSIELGIDEFQGCYFGEPTQHIKEAQ